jgi:hypothetical protein
MGTFTQLFVDDKNARQVIVEREQALHVGYYYANSSYWYMISCIKVIMFGLA